ncbi:unnamed protein product, partial [Sphagnum jensenii]
MKFNSAETVFSCLFSVGFFHCSSCFSCSYFLLSIFFTSSPFSGFIFHESSNGASGWSLVLSLPQSPTQPLLSLLLPCVSLDIDNKIIIAVMRL